MCICKRTLSAQVEQERFFKIGVDSDDDHKRFSSRCLPEESNTKSFAPPPSVGQECLGSYSALLATAPSSSTLNF